MIGGLYMHPIQAYPSSKIILVYLSTLKVAAKKFLKPKGSLLLTSLEDASHLTLEARRDSSLCSLKYMMPEWINFLWMGARESLTPPPFHKGYMLHNGWKGL